jgi:hypothetical protein
LPVVLVFLFPDAVVTGQTGVLHHAASLLLLLSGDRRFAVALNSPLHTKLPIDLVLTSCNYGDLLFMVRPSEHIRKK